MPEPCEKRRQRLTQQSYASSISYEGAVCKSMTIGAFTAEAAEKTNS